MVAKGFMGLARARLRPLGASELFFSSRDLARILASIRRRLIRSEDRRRESLCGEAERARGPFQESGNDGPLLFRKD